MPLWMLLLTSVLLVGCQHARLNHSERLMNRPDFPAVVESAPEWARDALKTINALEYEIERR